VLTQNPRAVIKVGCGEFRHSHAAKTFLLSEGTDMRYGARHLKRAIERLLVHTLSNLIATEQISTGDSIEFDFDKKEHKLRFPKIGEGLGLQQLRT
jgi:ATP-dependent Clp protease ATP-binding subunit ClpA